MEEKNNEFQNFEDENVMDVRMYFFVPYNISEIQKGIQAGHAALRYARQFSEENPEVWEFVENHETWIILNGGTMNEERDFNGIAEGTMNQLADQLMEGDIMFSYFHEPDLNKGLSALCFLADERVFSYELYPEFLQFLTETRSTDTEFAVECALKTSEELVSEYPDAYKEWVRSLGGIKNVLLRDITRGKKKA